MNKICATLFIVFSISLCAVTPASVEEGIAAFEGGAPISSSKVGS